MDIFCCVETWCTSTRLKEYNWFNNLSDGFAIIVVDPTKSNVKGRMNGGLLLCVNKTKFDIRSFESESSNILINLIDKKCSELIKISFAYFSPNSGENLMFESYVNKLRDTKPDIVFGDFNARIACLNTQSSYLRNSKDSKVQNKRGTYLINNTHHVICNGIIKGDNDGNFTFINKRGSSVVDLCLVSSDMFKEKLNLKGIENEHSHHAQILLMSRKVKGTILHRE